MLNHVKPTFSNSTSFDFTFYLGGLAAGRIITLLLRGEIIEPGARCLAVSSRLRVLTALASLGLALLEVAQGRLRGADALVTSARPMFPLFRLPTVLAQGVEGGRVRIIRLSAVRPGRNGLCLMAVDLSEIFLVRQ